MTGSGPPSLATLARSPSCSAGSSRLHPDDLYIAEYEGLYCTGCEEFKQESQIVNGHCIEHPTLELIRTRERNDFFRLSRYQEPVLDLIRSGKFRVEPAIRRNEVLRLLEGGLQDISVSRLRQPWGIPFPGDPEQTVYVWFDALINYLSATGFPDAGLRAALARGSPRDRQRHHPISLRDLAGHAAECPARAAARGVGPRLRAMGRHQDVEDSGTAVTLDEAIERHGPDPLRYFLLREVGFEADGNFTWERFDERYTADLADGLGNLASRTLAMLAKYRDGMVPRSAGSTTLDRAGAESVRRYAAAMDALDLRSGAEAAWSLVSAANLFVQQTAPWSLAKLRREAELDDALAALARALARLAVLASPFIPVKAQQLWRMLGLSGAVADAGWSAAEQPEVEGRRPSGPTCSFPSPPVSRTYRTHLAKLLDSERVITLKSP